MSIISSSESGDDVNHLPLPQHRYCSLTVIPLTTTTSTSTTKTPTATSTTMPPMTMTKTLYSMQSFASIQLRNAVMKCVLILIMMSSLKVKSA